jgi:hypothetical protein
MYFFQKKKQKVFKKRASGINNYPVPKKKFIHKDCFFLIWNNSRAYFLSFIFEKKEATDRVQKIYASRQSPYPKLHLLNWHQQWDK